jgi:hypothetical protein
MPIIGPTPENKIHPDHQNAINEANIGVPRGVIAEGTERFTRPFDVAHFGVTNANYTVRQSVVVGADGRVGGDPSYIADPYDKSRFAVARVAIINYPIGSD